MVQPSTEKQIFAVKMFHETGIKPFWSLYIITVNNYQPKIMQFLHVCIQASASSFDSQYTH